MKFIRKVAEISGEHQVVMDNLEIVAKVIELEKEKREKKKRKREELFVVVKLMTRHYVIVLGTIYYCS